MVMSIMDCIRWSKFLLISTNPREYTDYDGKEEGRYGIIVMVTPNGFTLLGGGRIQDE